MARLAGMPERPFNNPFTKSLAGLRQRLLERDRQQPVPPAPDPQTEQPSDDARFRASVEGVAPLDGSAGPEVRPRHPDKGRLRRRRAAENPAATDFDVRYSDLYIRGRAKGLSARVARELEEGRFAVHSHVDLHGMVLEDAMARVDDFIADSQRRGERCILVVTGKGNNSPGQQGVLRQSIPDWLARGPSARRVLAFASARPCDGGTGALYVLLRKSSARKARIRVETGPGP